MNPIDIAEEKFNNFKLFMKKIEGIDYKYIILLEQCNIETFFHGLKSYSSYNVDEIVLKICDKAGINVNTFFKTDKEIFKKYVSFFLDIMKILKI
jgi:hypothetical protein